MLDAVPGLGPARRAALLKAFGSVKAVSAATPEEIAAAVPGIGPKLAETVVAALHVCPGSRSGAAWPETGATGQQHIRGRAGYGEPGSMTEDAGERRNARRRPTS